MCTCLYIVHVCWQICHLFDQLKFFFSGLNCRSAKEAEQNIRKALEKGQVLPKEERFDSNCITPGMCLCLCILWLK